MPKCKIAYVTVPHSASRYIEDTFRQAGLTVEQATKRDVPEADVLWDHWFQPPHDENIQKALLVADHRFVVTRDPIMTWATFFHDASVHEYEGWDKARIAGNLMSNLISYYVRQNALAAYYDLPAFRADKDSIETLGKFVGVPLAQPGDTFGHEYDFKDAVRARDIEAIKEICRDTLYFERFMMELTPLIKDYYESIGYDIWWT